MPVHTPNDFFSAVYTSYRQGLVPQVVVGEAHCHAKFQFISRVRHHATFIMARYRTTRKYGRPPFLRPTPLQRVLTRLNSRDCYFPVSSFCDMGFCDDHFAYIVVADILSYCCAHLAGSDA